MNSNKKHISIYQKNERIHVEFKNIICVEAAGCYSIFHTTDAKIYVSCHQLKYYEEVLTKSSFFRINRSYIINEAYIKYFHVDTRELILSNKLRLFVSFRKRKSFVNTVYGNSQKLKYDRCIHTSNETSLLIKI